MTLPDGANGPLHDGARLIARYLYRPLLRTRVTGMERLPLNGPLVLVANHSSMLEPQLIFGALPRRSVFLVKSELFTGPLGYLLRGIGQLSVRRGEPDRAPLLAAVRILRAGGLVGVFPEGARGDGDVAVAEAGAAWLVRASGATVVPLAVRGTTKLASFRPKVDILVGEPFSPEVGRGRAGLKDGSELIRARLAELVRTLDEMRAGQDR